MKIFSKEKIVVTLTLIMLSLPLSPTLFAADSNMASVIRQDRANGVESGIESIGRIISSIPAPGLRPWGLGWDDQSNLLFVVTESPARYFRLDPNTGSVIDSLPLPFFNPTGLTFDGLSLWVASFNNAIIRIDWITGTVISSFFSPVVSPGVTDGLAFDGVNLWVTGFNDPLIYKVDPATGSTLGTIPAPGRWSRDITWDGTNLWLVHTNTDGSESEIYQISPVDGTVLNSFRLPSNVDFPLGITFDGNYLWISDWVGNTIYQVDPGLGWVLQQDASYGSGTLNLNYTLGSPAPATWSTGLILTQPSLTFIPLWEIPLPGISPPLDVPLSFPLPDIGTVGFFSILHDGVTLWAFDVDWIDTSAPAP